MNSNLVNLVEKIKLGDEKSFDLFYAETKRGVFFTISKFVKNKQQIEDLMQECYLSFFKAASTVDENKNPFSYLLTIATNCSINFLRKQKEEVAVENYDYFEASNEGCNAPLMQEAKKRLCPEDWRIIELCLIYGYKRVEVAKILNKPISTVNWKYNDILKRIGEFYKEVYFEKKD